LRESFQNDKADSGCLFLRRGGGSRTILRSATTLGKLDTGKNTLYPAACRFEKRSIGGQQGKVEA